MRTRTLGIVALAVALAVLGGTIAYALTGGSAHMGMSRSGYGMMGAAGERQAWYLDGAGPVRDVVNARRQAQRFADRLGLKTGEAMQFTDNFYVRLDDQGGAPATEVLVDPRSGDVTLEYGAAMMWNTRYGIMRGGATSMMGRGGSGMMGGPAARGGTMGRYGSGMGAAPGAGPLGANGARAAADRWLAAQRLAERAGEPDAFPGYFTMETVRDGKVAGMISVNARTGAVLYHWWHGRFVAEG